MATAPAFDPRATAITFAQLGDFAAVDAATKALRDAGFSIGSAQRGAPAGLLLGDVTISKWRNMSLQERRVLDGEMHGGRYGPITILPSAVAEDFVLDAFDLVRSAAYEAAGRLTVIVGGMVRDA